MDDRNLLTGDDLSEELVVPITTIYAWNHRGTGPPYIKVGKHVRYRREDVDRWLEEREVSR